MKQMHMKRVLVFTTLTYLILKIRWRYLHASKLKQENMTM